MSPLPLSQHPFRRRLFWAVLFLVVLFVLLLGRIVEMEILHYRRFRQMAQANHRDRKSVV